MRAVLIDGARAPFKPVSLRLRLWRAIDGRRPALWSVAAASVVLACGLAFFVDLPVRIQGSQSRPEPNRASVASAPVSHTTEPSKLKTPPVVAPEAATAAAAPRQTVAPKASEPLHNVVAPTTPDGELTLQVAAFRIHATALASAANLNSQGIEARVSEAKKGRQLIFLVHVGRFGSKEEAESFGRQLRALMSGHI
jgi:cell division septation protein DedD